MKTETFAQKMKRFQYHFDTRTVFDDFLTMTLCAFSQNPATGKSHDEDLYLQTIAKYKDSDLRFQFPELLACLTCEMEDRIDSGTGNDVLGDYYEQNIGRKELGQFFTPWHICMFMAKATAESTEKVKQDGGPLRILDPSCGSGRMLLASAAVNGPYMEYYGIDIDETCAKMTALNLFLNGLFRSEALCANALAPEDFRVSYRTSFLPFGVFRIQQREQSMLWHILKNSWDRKEKKEKQPPPELSGMPAPEGSQLKFF